MRIFLLRHGEAESYASSDSQRQLTAAGLHQVEQAARIFTLKESQQPDAILVSPYLRAQQTNERFLAAAFPGKQLSHRTYEGITPDSSPDKCIEYLQACTAQRLLLVTHQPFVGALLELLTSGSTYQPGSGNPPMLTSSIVCLETELIAPACAQLLWYSSPPHQG